MSGVGDLRVAVNLLWCDPGRVGGSEQYLVRQLAGLPPGATGTTGGTVAPTLFASDAFAAAHPDLTARHRVVRSPIDTGRRPPRVAVEHTWLAARTRRGFDLVHHGGGTAPLVGARPVLLTVHDLQFLEFPEYVAPTKLRYLRAMVPRSVRRARLVATPTEFVRGTVIEAYGVRPDDVVVVPHGVEVRGTPLDVDEAAVRARYGLGDGPLLVYPAITHPHKRHDLLLQALAHHWTDPDLRLVLLGGRGAAEDEVVAAIDRLGLAGRVVRPGRVPDADRDALVAIAEALVFPSRYEGFGAPLIEAMALGTPVVCGDHPALREVAGDAAVVLPDDVEAWAGALDVVRRRRAELVAAGHRRVEAFTIAVSGAALADAYRRTVA